MSGPNRPEWPTGCMIFAEGLCVEFGLNEEGGRAIKISEWRGVEWQPHSEMVAADGAEQPEQGEPPKALLVYDLDLSEAQKRRAR